MISKRNVAKKVEDPIADDIIETLEILTKNMGEPFKTCTSSVMGNVNLEATIDEGMDGGEKLCYDGGAEVRRRYAMGTVQWRI